MSTLRISNIEAKSVPASATIDEKVKITNSSGDVLVFLDGKTSGITTVGINTTDGNITFDANSNVVVTGIITATKFVGTIEPTNLTVGGDLTITDKIIHSGDTNTAIRFPSADTISAETDSTERLRISSNGLVNIGAGSSASGLSPILHLHKNASSTAYLHITNNNTGITNNDGFLLGINGVGDCLVFNKDSTPIRFATQGIERLRINSSGYVGVKRSTPLANLHTTNNELAIGANPTGAAAPNATYDGLVVDGEEASLINIRSCATGNLSYGRVAFSDDVRSRGYIDYRHRDGAGGALEFMNFAVAGSERIRIQSNGGLIKYGANINLNSAYIDFSGSISTPSTAAAIYRPADNTLAFSTANNERIRVTNGGLDPSTDAVTDLGNSSKRYRNLYVSGGVVFDAVVGNATSNTLDDYEEGNHNTTVTMSGDTSFSYVNRTLSYTKIGRLVHVTGRIHVNNAGGTSFAFTLPFTCASGVENETSNEIQNIRFNDGYTFRISPSTAEARLQSDGNNTGVGVGNPHINVNLTYHAA